ncbi:MAG: Ubiquinone biosynthesis O-methyltransferase [Elusimicrobia bacterium]|nr:Ubiquinone biosynthesis O-methyltransferase [Elusimicrobiota bacterium]
MDLSRRAELLEIMDTETLSLPEMRQTLRFLETTNKYFGGTAVIIRCLERWSKHWPKNQTVRVLDIGTGGAEIPIAMARWAKSNGHKVHITGIDLVDEISRIAAQNAADWPNVTIRRADFFDLTDSNEKFDYVISSLLLHHVPTEKIICALQAFDRLCARGLIISDLLRNRAGYWAVTAAGVLFGNKIVRHDGPVSVRRAFTPNELRSWAMAAGLNYLQAKKEPWFRVSLAGEKTSPHPSPLPNIGRGGTDKSPVHHALVDGEKAGCAK